MVYIADDVSKNLKISMVAWIFLFRAAEAALLAFAIAAAEDAVAAAAGPAFAPPEALLPFASLTFEPAFEFTLALLLLLLLWWLLLPSVGIARFVSVDKAAKLSLSTNSTFFSEFNLEFAVLKAIISFIKDNTYTKTL